ncbi:MAG: hypothetical protein GY794_04255 [bacterium]|nr:hypothetical protein [bacterium]
MSITRMRGLHFDPNNPSPRNLWSILSVDRCKGMQNSSTGKCFTLASVTILLIIQGCRGEQAESVTGELVPLELNGPKFWIHGPHVGVNYGPNLEEAPGKRAAFMVPPNTVNLAAGSPVTSNEPLPIIGELGMAVDGVNKSDGSNLVNLGFGRKWIQIDLQQCAPIYAIVVWRLRVTQYHDVYTDFIVRVSNDPEFRRGVHTLFNNDDDNSAGLGRGKDKRYLETLDGRLIDAGGVSARYVRFYSNGNWSNDDNVYSEVAVYGLGRISHKPKSRNH